MRRNVRPLRPPSNAKTAEWPEVIGHRVGAPIDAPGGGGVPWASARECPLRRDPPGYAAGSAVENVDLGDLAVSHREDGSRCIWHAPRSAPALPVAASYLE